MINIFKKKQLKNKYQEIDKQYYEETLENFLNETNRFKTGSSTDINTIWKYFNEWQKEKEFQLTYEAFYFMLLEMNQTFVEDECGCSSIHFKIYPKKWRDEKTNG